MTPILLCPTPPYHFARTLKAARFLCVLGRELPTPTGVAYRRALRVGGGLALVEIDMPDASALRVRLLAATAVVDEAALAHVVGRIMNIHADLAPFYAAAQRDSALWATVEPLIGTRALQTETVFEALVTTMIEQQIALSAAQRAERWLIATYGDGIVYDGDRYSVFPMAAQIAALTVADLTPLKITFQRMARIIRIAQGQVNGDHDLESWRSLPVEALRARLVGLHGVGDWTAAWTITRATGECAYVGSADVALRSAANAYYYGARGRMERAALDAHFERYAPFAGAAGYYTLMRYAFEKYP